MEQEALIIFVRKPELGKVKTRLAASVGDTTALAIYEKLLLHTHAITSVMRCDKFVFYNDTVEEDDLWNRGYEKRVQAGTGLGDRMMAAFELLFAKGYKRICIIGSDCFELTTTLIQDAFAKLLEKDVVIGPAKDGGYYLLGMKGGVKRVFDDVEWSTEKVFEQTKTWLHHHGYSYSLLPVLQDVDTINNVPEDLLTLLATVAAQKK